jgi:hypothetical protein
MTTTELAELILARMHDRAQVQGYAQEFDLIAIAHEFGVADNHKVNNAAKVLDGRGLISAGFLYGGGVCAFLTGEGSIAVEQGGTTGIIHAYRHNPQRYLVSVVDHSTHSTHINAPLSADNIAINAQMGSQSATSSALSPEVLDLLDRISHQLRQSAELTEARRRELLDDIQTLCLELQRAAPRTGMIHELLSPLANIATISDLVIQLYPYLPK